MTLVIVVLSLIVSVVALLVVLVAWREIRRPGPSDTGVDQVPEDVLGLRQEVAALRAELALAVRHVAVVRYDAFADSGGRLSWSTALLDDRGDGLVLTAIHGRQDARSYAKSITGWKGEQLSDEEQQAVSHARG